MNLKEQIVETMTQQPKLLLSEDEWVRRLRLFSQEEITELSQTLYQLEEDGVITLTHKDKFILTAEAGWIKGMLSINPKGFGFVDLEEGSVYIHANSMKDAMHHDTVLVKPKVYKDGTSEGEVVKVLERSVTQLVGTWAKTPDGLGLSVNDARIRQKIAMDPEDSLHLTEGQQILAEIVKYGDPLQVKLKKVLGNANDPGMDVLTVLYEYGIEPNFPDDVMAQVETLDMVVTEKAKIGRKDYTDRMVVTIDGEDAKDLDDAISLTREGNNYRLQVHIADVSHYVQAYTPIDIEAENRTTSVYVVDRVVPMLPHALSNGVCSLNPHVERLTLTCDMLVTPDGNVDTYEIVPSYIKSYARMTYTDVNRILNQEPEALDKYKDSKDLFILMSEVAQVIRQRRVRNGAIDFETAEAKIIVDQNGKIKEIKKRERQEAEMIIEDFMIQANEVVARHMKWLDIPSLYRIHQTPEKRKMQEFAKIALIMGERLKGDLANVQPLTLQKLLTRSIEKPEYQVLSSLLLRSMQKAKYDPQCLGHFGLALKEYLHFTSPIRRYPDLIVHRMLHKYVFNVPDESQRPIDTDLVETYARETSLGERNAVEAERDVEDMKKAEYMEEHIGETFNGVISSVLKFGIFVQLDNTIEGLVHITNLTDDYYEYDPRSLSLRGSRHHKIYSLGQKVRIKVKDASKEKKTIDFVLIEKQVKRTSSQYPIKAGGSTRGNKNRIHQPKSHT